MRLALLRKDCSVLQMSWTTTVWLTMSTIPRTPCTILILFSTSLFSNLESTSIQSRYMSHPAIIAREYRVPAVVATSNGTKLMHDGDIVTVDGDTGTGKLETAVRSEPLS